jgi:hypothetical protein
MVKKVDEIEKVPKCRICAHPDREEWRPIEGFENAYHVSSLGRVKSLGRTVKRAFAGELRVPERIIKSHVTEHGYEVVGLWANGKIKNARVHVLVAKAFVPNPEGKRCVNHVNGNKLDNRFENLEWCTHSENMKHAYDTGLNSSIGRAVKASIEKNKRRVVRSDGVVFDSISDAKRETGVNNISACCRGVQKTAGGYGWKYYG